VNPVAKVTDPISFGPLKLRNRLVGAPLLITGGIDPNSRTLTQAVIDLYRERAAGGIGMITLHGTMIGTEPEVMLGGGGGGTFVTDEQVESFARVAEAIHAEGVPCTLQLVHGGRQVPDLRYILGQEGAPLPSAPSDSTPPFAQFKPHGLTLEETEAMIDAHVAAAIRAKKAGYDGVTYHGAHGFMLMEFMSPYTNTGRDDQYGKDRMLFATELVRRTREACGPDFAIIVRVSVTEGMGKRGITPELVATEIGPRLEAAGIDALDLSAGNFETFYFVGPPLYWPRGVYIDWMEKVQKALTIPVIGVGRINDPRLVERILAEERVQAVALGRALLADPEFPNKMISGRWDEIRKCIACNACVFNPSPHSAAFACAVNPLLARPVDQEKARTPAERRKRVLVVGGGPGGMQAAEIAAMRGHEVTLFEKRKELGGQINIGSSMPRVYTKELTLVVKWLSERLKELGVNVQTGHEVTPGEIREMSPDVVLVATGAKMIRPDIPGVNKPHVVTQEEVIEKSLTLGRRIIVVGARYGSEIALSLARQGKEVVLVEELGEAFNCSTPYFGLTWRNQLLPEMMHREPLLRIRNGVKVNEIYDDEVSVNWSERLRWQELLPADNVVLALGPVADKSFAEALGGKEFEVRTIGDMNEPRSIFWAVQEGAQAGLEI
jgi:2,4-dienoyl-CoA reductase-like NADH-dependent reductase (Old Yellow Enzyme family)/thioredoxin reductase